MHIFPNLQIFKRWKKAKNLQNFIINICSLWNHRNGVICSKKLNVVGYLKAQKNDSTFIKDNYVKVDYSQIKVPTQKNNLIVIYLESMESTFSSITKGGKYKKNYIPNLTKIAENNISFSDSEKWEELKWLMAWLGQLLDY